MPKKEKQPRKPRSQRTQPRAGASATRAAAPPDGWDAPPPEPALRPGRDTPTTLTVRVELAGSEPAVWRRLDLANVLTLDVLHRVLQGAMGWESAHLHGFQVPATDGQRWASIVDASFDDPGSVRETDVRLDQVLAGPDDVLVYEYDFGDSWTHVLQIESERERAHDDPIASVLDGARACPPEDIGGVYAFNEIVAALTAQAEVDGEIGDLLEGLEDYDPEAFDVSRTDSWVRRLLPTRR
jgi:hypothetical protein